MCDLSSTICKSMSSSISPTFSGTFCISGGSMTFDGNNNRFNLRTGLFKCWEFLNPSFDNSILSFLRPSILTLLKIDSAFKASKGVRYSTKQNPLFFEALSIMHRTSTTGPEPQTTLWMTSTSQLYGIAPTYSTQDEDIAAGFLVGVERTWLSLFWLVSPLTLATLSN